MEKVIQMNAKAGAHGLVLQMRLDEFEMKSGISIDPDDIDEFTEEEIADYVIEHFDEDRYGFCIDEDTTITFTGFKILDEDDEEVVQM